MQKLHERGRGLIVTVSFNAGQFHGEWNTELFDSFWQRPVGVSPERALDDAVFANNYLKDRETITSLKEYKQMRAFLIERHFQFCARKLIEQIEATEGWEEWESKIGRT